MKRKRWFVGIFLLSMLLLLTGCFLKNNSRDILQALKAKYNEKFVIVEHPDRNNGYFKISPKGNPDLVFDARYRFSGDGSVIPKFKNRLTDNYDHLLLENYAEWLRNKYPELGLSINDSGVRIIVSVNSYENINQVYDLLQHFDESEHPLVPHQSFDVYKEWFFASILFSDGTLLPVDSFIENSDYTSFYDTVFPEYLCSERTEGNDLSNIPEKELAQYPANYLARVHVSDALDEQLSTRPSAFSWIRFDDDGVCYVRKKNLIDMLHTFDLTIYLEQKKEAVDLLYSDGELKVKTFDGELVTVSEDTTLTWNNQDNTQIFYPLTGEIRSNEKTYLIAQEMMEYQLQRQGYPLNDMADLLDLEMTFDKRTGLLSIQ
ncbi:hypothetical protein [uncultured Enterococcus sp.]|uniref:hypothetical protein n=1 Tax=uncultured Enterococcus sp. TaxID=167972 RepID=UPI002AA861BB|nr:hypothetical protein [uncultured Enterococcus sp.]